VHDNPDVEAVGTIRLDLLVVVVVPVGVHVPLQPTNVPQVAVAVIA